MSLLVTGSIGIDTVETPHGMARDVLGGSAVYFSLAASLFSPVRTVGVVGDDFPEDLLAVFKDRPVDAAGIERRRGSRTFRWHGKYVGDMNAAQTIRTDLNVLGEAGPKIPPSFRDSRYVFLANTHPALQRDLLSQLAAPRLVVCDTMNLWIDTTREELLRTLGMVHGVVLNDGEARLLTGKSGLVDAARAVLELGPRFVIIKKGEHGSLLVERDDLFVLPAFPTTEVRDPTVTDANVMTGKLISDFFPRIFGPHQDEPLDAEAVREAFAELARDVGDGRSPEDVADGFIRIAVENMANAIKKISVQRGYDVTRYALNCFGGAGGQHACLVADALGMTTVLIHPFSSLLSAYGMGLADIRATRQQAIELPLDGKALAAIKKVASQLGKEAKKEVAGQGVPPGKIKILVRAHIRYAGTDTALEVNAGPLAKMKSAFEKVHKARFGFIDRGKQLVVEAVSVEAVGGGAKFRETTLKKTGTRLPSPARRTEFFSTGRWHDAAIFTRDQLKPGHKVDGPAIIIEPHQTVVIETGWRAEVTVKNHLLLKRVMPLARQRAVGTRADPVMLEVFNNLFMAIAEQMGVALQNTASSVNIKERLDFSCAVFSAEGTLVANAPHMPVHLGSMDRALETIIRQNPTIRPGDVYAINAPYNGGTHLPDITVCTPVFDDKKRAILFWVASRGHHADIGGISPGSMSPNAVTIGEEGVYIDNFKLVERGRFREKDIHALLTGATYPARNPQQNINDLKAQIAANEKGAQELRKMADQFGLGIVRAYMDHVQDNAAESVRRVIDRLRDGEFKYEMDQGTAIKVKISVDRRKREATVDFTGTSPQQPDNFNAPEPVTRAAVLYAFRVMVDDDIPMNAGCLRPIRIVIPPRSMLSPEYPAAVVAGNVETSQAVTNCLFGALGAMAAAQGTMNNLNFGNAKYQYYETICSGSPAGPGFPGTDAVQTHMTNTRLTDPEVLEQRYPVLLEDFHIRKNSGGRGKWNAGDGVLRTIRFLEKMQCTILSGHRRVRPFGLAGGEPGQLGENLVRRKDGRMEKLQACDATTLEAGEAVIIKTPTAGGYGSPDR